MIFGNGIGVRNQERGVTGSVMLPLLDLLFATIGIFLTVFALQQIVQEHQRRLPLPDAILVCLPDRMLVWHDRFDTGSRRGSVDDMAGWLKQAGERSGLFRILIALGPGALETERQVQARLGQLLSVHDAGNDPGVDSGLPAVRYTVWPLPAKDDAGAELVGAWRAQLSGSEAW